jgi:hypothetical protein
MKLSDALDMGYIGVDFVVDAKIGPVVLEANARPGLAIQVAHRQGLLPRLQLIDSLPPEALVGNRRWELLPRIAGEVQDPVDAALEHELAELVAVGGELNRAVRPATDGPRIDRPAEQPAAESPPVSVG